MSGGFWEGVLWGMGFCRDEEKERKRRSKKCPYRERRILVDAKYCPYCGAKL